MFKKNKTQLKIVPIVKFNKFYGKISEDEIKSMLVNEISKFLEDYINFNIKEEPDNIKLMSARLDIIDMSNTENNNANFNSGNKTKKI